MRIPTHHARQFSFALIPADFAHLGGPIIFLDDEVLVAKSRDLGQVCHNNNLPRLGKLLQARPNLGRGLPADSRVDFVKIKVDEASVRPSINSSASMTRDSSPPEAP